VAHAIRLHLIPCVCPHPHSVPGPLSGPGAARRIVTRLGEGRALGASLDIFLETH
jgi:hypothetical protein